MAARVDWDVARAELEPLLARGLQHAEIAGRLGLTLSTVKFRVSWLGLSRPRQCRRDGQQLNHAQLNRTASMRGGTYERKPGADRNERVERHCCRCGKHFVAKTRFLRRCPPCRALSD